MAKTIFLSLSFVCFFTHTALHELDNEIEEVTEDLYPRVISFFDSI
jgi:hypothetical protein